MEGLHVAEALQLGLDAVAECTVWNQSAFKQGYSIAENIERIANNTDYAAIILTADDIVTKRRKKGFAPRDNLLYELGQFRGKLGVDRTFLVRCRDDAISLPSDLQGVIMLTYAHRTDGNIHAALGPVCTQIKMSIGAIGSR